VAARFPVVKGFAVLYLPMNDTADDEEIEPILAECDPLPRDLVWGKMEDRWAKTEKYLAAILEGDQDEFLNDELAEPMERTQSLGWNARASVWDVKLVPHWSTRFCPFDDALCDCNTQGVTKIGHFDLIDGNVKYVPRKGYEDVTCHVLPENLTKFQVRRMYERDEAARAA
jgi:hypothetical protein